MADWFWKWVARKAAPHLSPNAQSNERSAVDAINHRLEQLEAEIPGIAEKAVCSARAFRPKGL